MGKDCRKRDCCRERDFKEKECKEKNFKGRNLPEDIRELLCLLSRDDNNRVTLVLDTCEDCILEDVCLVAVLGDLAVFRYHDKFKFVKICCICAVIVDCEVILDELLEGQNDC